MEGLEPIAAHAQEPVPEGGWGAETPPAEGWAAGAAPESAAPAEAGWADETPEPPAAEAPSGDFGAAQDWSASSESQGWGGEQKPAATDGGWGESGSWGAEGAPAPAAESP